MRSQLSSCCAHHTQMLHEQALLVLQLGLFGAVRVLLAFPDVQGKQEMTRSLGKLKGSTFENVHVDIDLTPAQAALRRTKQPDF